MYEFPLHGVFIERTIEDWIHGSIYDVIIGRMLLFNIKYINGNEVQ